MSKETLSAYLIELAEESQTYLIYTEPEIVDFTTPSPGSLVVRTDKTSVKIPLSDMDELAAYISMLEASIFQEGRKVICWNIKNLMTYIKYHLPYFEMAISSLLVDLKIAESFLGIKLERPNTVSEAIGRLRTVVQNDKLVHIYRSIHKPLALHVLPAIEAAGVVDISSGPRIVHPYYEIEGQVNGRLRCTQPFDKCINPHVLTDERKSMLRTNNDDEVFLVFDYSHMEVSMLQWLSSDPVLGEITQSGQDPYKKIYEIISGKPCKADAHRKFAKDIFLPVIYGMQAYTLGERHGIGTKGATYILKAIHSNFSRAMEYLESYQEKLKVNPLVEDRFGRQRKFEEDHYKVRNFLIQAPASMLCLEKLVALHYAIQFSGRIILSIHDGYVMVVHKDNLAHVEKVTEQVLLGPSKLCPGINLQVKKNSGSRLISP